MKSTIFLNDEFYVLHFRDRFYVMERNFMFLFAYNRVELTRLNMKFVSTSNTAIEFFLKI